MIGAMSLFPWYLRTYLYGLPVIRHLIRRQDDDDQESWGVRPVDWYNRAYAQTRDYHQHYSASSYYFLWTVITDRILRSGVRRILDLGCGPGQFASLLYDKGLKEYRGVDFSPTAIEMAKRRAPSFEFIVADLSQSAVLNTSTYDCVVAMEFLEHVEFDLDVIKSIRAGTKVFATVPNFPYVSHVRHFENESDVKSRYQRFFSDFSVDAFLADSTGKTFYLIEGTKA